MEGFGDDHPTHPRAAPGQRHRAPVHRGLRAEFDGGQLVPELGRRRSFRTLGVQTGREDHHQLAGDLGRSAAGVACSSISSCRVGVCPSVGQRGGWPASRAYKVAASE